MSVLGVSLLPTSILVDPAGRELGRLEGDADWDTPEGDRADEGGHRQRRLDRTRHLAGPLVVITGASSGIGLAAGPRLRQGRQCAAADRPPHEAGRRAAGRPHGLRRGRRRRLCRAGARHPRCRAEIRQDRLPDQQRRHGRRARLHRCRTRGLCPRDRRQPQGRPERHQGRDRRHAGPQVGHHHQHQLDQRSQDQPGRGGLHRLQIRRPRRRRIAARSGRHAGRARDQRGAGLHQDQHPPGHGHQLRGLLPQSSAIPISWRPRNWPRSCSIAGSCHRRSASATSSWRRRGRASRETWARRRDRTSSGRHSGTAARRAAPCRGTARPVRPAGSSWQSRCRRSRAGNGRAI